SLLFLTYQKEMAAKPPAPLSGADKFATAMRRFHGIATVCHRDAENVRCSAIETLKNQNVSISTFNMDFLLIAFVIIGSLIGIILIVHAIVRAFRELVRGSTRNWFACVTTFRSGPAGLTGS